MYTILRSGSLKSIFSWNSIAQKPNKILDKNTDLKGMDKKEVNLFAIMI